MTSDNKETLDNERWNTCMVIMKNNLCLLVTLKNSFNLIKMFFSKIYLNKNILQFSLNLIITFQRTAN